MTKFPVRREAVSLSVVVPCCNHAPYLVERLGSIQAQTVTDITVLFLDDGSTDGSFEVARQLVGDDPRFIFLRTPASTGNPFAAWVFGLDQVSSRFVWIAESDDACEPDFLENLLPILESDPSVGLVYCQSVAVDTVGRKVGTLLRHTDDIDYYRWRSDYVAEGPDECRRALVFRNTIPNASACVFRLEALRQALDAAEGFRLCGDWAVYVSLLSAGWRIAYSARPRNRYRCHDASQRQALAGQGVELLETARIRLRLRQTLSLNTAVVAMASELTRHRLAELAREWGAEAAGGWFANGELLRLLTAFDPQFCDMLIGSAPNRTFWCDVYAAAAGVFHEGGKVSLAYAANERTTLRVLVPSGRLRIDPGRTPGLYRLYGVTAREPSTGQVLKRFAEASLRWIATSGTCFVLDHGPGVLVYAYGDDPIFLVPGLDAPGPEVLLEIDLTGYSLIGRAGDGPGPCPAA